MQSKPAKTEKGEGEKQVINRWNKQKSIPPVSISILNVNIDLNIPIEKQDCQRRRPHELSLRPLKRE